MQLYIGTSGWLYDDWVGKFYPADMKDRDKLTFLSKHFNTVEINSTFYRMPPAKTFERWKEVVPAKFKYSVKFSRYITRTKRLILDDESKPFIQEFLNRCALLKSRLAVILFQLPPSLKIDLERLDAFLKYVHAYSRKIKLRSLFAIEFRNKSWFDEDVYRILKEHNTAFVIADSSRYPCEKAVTADFVYVRLHGPDELFASKYSDEQLKQWHGFVESQRRIKKCFVYFNNDFYGYAIDNAKSFAGLFGS